MCEIHLDDKTSASPTRTAAAVSTSPGVTQYNRQHDSIATLHHYVTKLLSTTLDKLS